MKRKLLSLVITLVCVCISVSYALDNSSKWEISKQLGEAAIRMSPKTEMYIADRGAEMRTTDSPTLKTDLEEFESLLARGANPAEIRIAGYVAAGPREMGSGLRLMSSNSGSPGHVVPAKEGGMSILAYLSINDLHEALSLLVNMGKLDTVAVNEKVTENGFTALILASQNGHEALVKQLLNKGADVNAKTNLSATALIMASQSCHTEVVRELLEKNADVNAKMFNGYMALMAASQRGCVDVVKELLNKGADVNAKMNNGVTALMGASQNGHTELVKLLLNNNADVNAKANTGGTALITACVNERTDIVKLLIGKGADVSAKLTEGGVEWTPLKLAKHYGLTEIATILEGAGAKE